MIELKEKASNYAEENVIKVLKEAFAKVYADGYHDGYKDCEEEIPVDLRDGKTEYVDLGLPSGTLWSSDFEVNGEDVSYLPYDIANKYEIPTKEQFNELLESCHWEFHYLNRAEREYICVGPNGKHIVFHSRGNKLAEEKREGDKIFFWVKSNTDSTSKEAAYLYYHSGEIKETREFFSGYKLPIRLVRKK